jgi:hypothetical protein
MLRKASLRSMVLSLVRRVHICRKASGSAGSFSVAVLAELLRADLNADGVEELLN